MMLRYVFIFFMKIFILAALLLLSRQASVTELLLAWVEENHSSIENHIQKSSTTQDQLLGRVDDHTFRNWQISTKHVDQIEMTDGEIVQSLAFGSNSEYFTVLYNNFALLSTEIQDKEWIKFAMHKDHETKERIDFLTYHDYEGISFIDSADKTLNRLAILKRGSTEQASVFEEEGNSVLMLNNLQQQQKLFYMLYSQNKEIQDVMELFEFIVQNLIDIEKEFELQNTEAPKANQPPQPKPAEPKKADDKPAEPKKADDKSAEPKKADEKPAEPKKADDKPAEPKKADDKSAEPKKADDKPAEPKKADDKPAEPKKAEEKPAEAKKADDKPAEPKKADDKPAEPKKAEEKPVEPKKADEKPAEAKKAEGKPADSKKPPEQAADLKKQTEKPAEPVQKVDDNKPKAGDNENEVENLHDDEEDDEDQGQKVENKAPAAKVEKPAQGAPRPAGAEPQKPKVTETVVKDEPKILVKPVPPAPQTKPLKGEDEESSESEDDGCGPLVNDQDTAVYTDYDEEEEKLKKQKKGKKLIAGENVVEDQTEKCIILYSQCHFEGETMQLCGSSPTIKESQRNFVVKGMKVPDGVKVTFYNKPQFENQKLSANREIECLEQPLVLNLFELSGNLRHHVQSNVNSVMVH